MTTMMVDLVDEAARQLRAEGVEVTPRAIEGARNVLIKLQQSNERGSVRGTRVTVAEAVAAVNAVCKKLENVQPAAPERVVTREFLTPRTPGASSSEVKTVAIPKGKREARQYAQPTPHFDAAHAARITAEDELKKLTARAKDLQAIVDDPTVDAKTREQAHAELTPILQRIAAIEQALHPAPQAGDAPTAGARQFAAPKPYWENGEDRKGGGR